MQDDITDLTEELRKIEQAISQAEQEVEKSPSTKVDARLTQLQEKATELRVAIGGVCDRQHPYAWR